MRREAKQVLIFTTLSVAVAMGGLWILSIMLQWRDPSAELVRTTREALQTAREAREEAEDTRRAASALRVVALVVGVAAPLAAAYAIYRLTLQQEPAMDEVLQVLEREGLLPGGRAATRTLPGQKRLLVEWRGDKDERSPG